MVNRSLKAKPHLRILLSSAGAKIPMLQALRNAAKRISEAVVIIAGDSNRPVVSEYFADEFWLMPRLDEVDISQLLRDLQMREITHIVPSRDGELLFWSGLKTQLNALGIEVLVAPIQAINRCLDKLLFFEFLTQKGLPAIPCYTHLMLHNESSQRWVVKERFGAGSQSVALSVDLEYAIAHGKRLTSPLFQPYISGREVSIDAWLNNQGRLKAHIYRYRIKVEHGESQITQTVALPHYDQQISDVLQALQLTGPVVLQAIIDEQEQLHLIECNSRFGGASTLGIVAGVDSLYWSLAESCGQDINAIPFHPASAPLTQVRFAGDRYL